MNENENGIENVCIALWIIPDKYEVVQVQGDLHRFMKNNTAYEDLPYGC